MPRTIATIGYEGATLAEVLAALKNASVDTVIDVRALPLSRKKGFSKKQFAAHMQKHGIDYVHIKSLGTPKPGRDAARAGNAALFGKIFADHLRTDAAQEGLAQATSLARAQRVCLMCFEADHTKCHRTIVAERIARATGLKIVHAAIRDT